MGCDIHAYGELQKDTSEWALVPLIPNPFDWRNYSLYAFLAGVRNYSGVTPIAPPRGLPETMSTEVRDAAEDWNLDAHNCSWLTMEELLAFDYDGLMEDRRITVQTSQNSWDGGRTAKSGGGVTMTYREFLRESYFVELERLKNAGVERIVFWFDN